MQPVKIGIIGVSGFGETHLKHINACEQEGTAELVAAVIRTPHSDKEKQQKEQELIEKGVRIYRDYQSMLQKEKDATELVAIPAGISAHAPLSTEVLRAGYHVICEKPVAGSVEEALQMADTQTETGNILAIGYQNIFSPCIQNIKQLRLEQRLGELLKTKSYALWPRHSDYYERNYWAGRIAVDGKPVYDSPAQNAVAHFLNNLLYLAGESKDASAIPKKVYGENYNAQHIPSADTQYIRAVTDNDIEVYFFATHAVEEEDKEGPIAHYVFEDGYIEWRGPQNAKAKVYEYRDRDEPALIAEFDNDDVNMHTEVFRDTCRAIRQGDQPLANIHNSWQHTLAIRAAFASSNGVHRIPGQYRRDQIQTIHASGQEGEHSVINTVIPGIGDTIRRLYSENKGYAENGIPWAVPGTWIDKGEFL